MGSKTERPISSSSMEVWTILGTVASVAGVILAIAFRLKDKHEHKMKKSNRPDQG